jgi:hypothetical protein
MIALGRVKLDCNFIGDAAAMNVYAQPHLRMRPATDASDIKYFQVKHVQLKFDGSGAGQRRAEYLGESKVCTSGHLLHIATGTRAGTTEY